MNRGPDETVIEPLGSDDLPSLFDLYRRVMAFPPPGSVETYWDWRFRRNPFDKGTGPIFWVAKQRGRIVGGIARMPAILNVEGQEIESHWAADFMVDPGHRGQGLGRRIFDHYRATSDVAISMGYAPDSATSRIARSVGFECLSPFPYLFKFYSPRLLSDRFPWGSRFGETLVNVSRPLFKLTGGTWKHDAPPDVHLEPIVRFDAAFDALWARVASDFPVTVRRTHATMNWRYFENPFFRYRTAGAWRSGELVGCLVLKVVRGERFSYGTIPEIVVPKAEEAVQQALLAWALGEFEEAKVDVVKSLLSPGCLSRLLRRAGFFAIGKGCDFVFAVSHGLSPLVSRACGISGGWYLTKGDGDCDIVPDFMRHTTPHATAPQG